MHEVISITRAHHRGPTLRVAIDVPLFDPWWVWRVVFRMWVSR